MNFCFFSMTNNRGNMSHGGLHDRITHKMKLLPFTLKKTEQYLLIMDFIGAASR